MGARAGKGGTATVAWRERGAHVPRRRWTWLGLVALLCMLPLPAAAISILPGQSLEVDFSLVAPAPTADVVTFNLAPGYTSATGFTGMTVSLYDGNTLLASRTSTTADPTELTAFASPGSLWTFDAVTADLSSVQDGSITGRVVLTPTFDGSPGASLDAVFFSATGLYVGTATTSKQMDALSAGSLIIDGPVALPEPSALALLSAAALLGIGVPGRR